MDSDAAYEKIRQWASGLKLTIKNAGAPVDRAQALAEAIATLRLTQLPQPAEPDREAVRLLVLDYLAVQKNAPTVSESEDELIGATLEALVQAAAKKKISSLENQPYFGCHRSADTRPPHPQPNP